MTDQHHREVPQRVSLRPGATSADQEIPGRTASPADPAAVPPAGEEGIERPTGGIDLMYYPDDPSDMMLVVEQPNGELLSIPLTEMKAARLRQALAAQESAAAFLRHELAGGTAEDYAGPIAPTMFSQEPGPGEFVDQDPELADDDAVDDDSAFTSVGRRMRKVANPDPAHVKDAAGELVDQTIKGIAVKHVVLGIFAVVFVIVIVQGILSWW